MCVHAGGATSCIGRGSHPDRATPPAGQGPLAQGQASQEEDEEHWSSLACEWPCPLSSAEQKHTSAACLPAFLQSPAARQPNVAEQAFSKQSLAYYYGSHAFVPLDMFSNDCAGSCCIQVNWSKLVSMTADQDDHVEYLIADIVVAF